MAWLRSYTRPFLLLILQSLFTATQNSGNIPVGQSLPATINGSPWLSPSGDFAFGFFKLPDRNNLFLLSIWYAKIPDTNVWYANNGTPVSEGSTVKITANEGLVLSDPQGHNIWNSSNELSSTGVSYGVMNDTGNFALKRSNNNPVWQSFDHPTDTLLPGQLLKINGKITSRRSKTSFAQGRFQLSLILDGVFFNTRDLDTGHAYDPFYNVSGNITQDGPNKASQGLIFNESGYMYLLMKDGSTYDLIPAIKTLQATEYYQRATLEFDGVLAFYTVPKSSADDGWSTLHLIPDDICNTSSPNGTDSGICGFNSICSLGYNLRPICSCPEGYSLLDPNDAYGSCVPNFKLGVCPVDGQRDVQDDYKLIKHNNTNFPHADYACQIPITEENCQRSCLNDCFCAAAHYNEHFSRCWKKRIPLSNGIKGSHVRGTTYIKVAKGKTSNLFDKKAAALALLGSSVSVNFILLTAIVLGILIRHRKNCFRYHAQPQKITFSEFTSIHCFSYKELEQATYRFTQEIGRGAFGVVYKGYIRAQGLPLYVAVKKLDRISRDADKEFDTEVNVIGQTHHKNLVRFIGFCKEGGQRLLVYEYMSNGTLADCLFGGLRPSWTVRVQIAQGIAQGLLYLHEECGRQIIHCDIKPHNMLLDETQNACISDFGLAKLLDLNQTQTNTIIRGTKGYVAPEWFSNKPITVKVDVYSYGILLLEIICCRKSVCMEFFDERGAILTDWAFECYQSSNLDSLVNDDDEALMDRPQLERFVMVALWCIQYNPSLRPTMKRVVQMLEGTTEVASPPCPT